MRPAASTQNRKVSFAFAVAVSVTGAPSSTSSVTVAPVLPPLIATVPTPVADAVRATVLSGAGSSPASEYGSDVSEKLSI